MIAHNYLFNGRIYLRAVEPEDLDVMYEMENNPAYWDISSFNVPYSRYTLKQYIENSCNDIYADKQLRLMIVLKPDNQVIGTIDITDYCPMHARGFVGIAVRKEYRHQNYAADALGLLLDYAFSFLSFNQLCAFIPADNEASIHLFSTNGFERSGLLKEWLRSGETYRDVVVLQRLNSKTVLAETWTKSHT